MVSLADGHFIATLVNVLCASRTSEPMVDRPSACSTHSQRVRGATTVATSKQGDAVRSVTFMMIAMAWPALLAAAEVTDIRAVCRHGQTFVTWQDVAAGEEGARYRYGLYRSNRPITADNLKQAT